MVTREAVRQAVDALTDELVVSTTGYISRDTCAAMDRPGNFYMIGSMGLASAIGLGLALRRPLRRVAVFDGDGALLMGLGTLAMVAELHPKNFYHLVFDNEAFASTGRQPTHARHVGLDRVAAACGYPRVERVDHGDVTSAARRLFSAPGPALLLIKCVADGSSPAGRIAQAPPELTRRMMEAAQG